MSQPPWQGGPPQGGAEQGGPQMPTPYPRQRPERFQGQVPQPEQPAQPGQSGRQGSPAQPDRAAQSGQPAQPGQPVQQGQAAQQGHTAPPGQPHSQQGRPLPQQDRPAPQPQRGQPAPQPGRTMQGDLGEPGADRPPARPVPALVAVALAGIIALALLGLAVYTVVAGWAGAAGGGQLVLVLLALIIAGVGVLYGLGAAAVLHPRFPNSSGMMMANTAVLLVVAGGLFRSARGWNDGAGAATLLAWLVMAAIAITSMVLVSRPSVQEWMQATQDRSRRQGHVPRR